MAGLFAGVGGIEVGLQRAGHRGGLLCENDPGALEVLRARFPNLRLVEDVRSLKRLPDDTELVAAGFPCQDLSQAGKTLGLAGASSGLVAEVFRLLRGRKSRGKSVPWVLLENVPFMLHLGKGRALQGIVGELERLGYSWAYRVVDSRAFGLPQRRQRVFLLASTVGDPRDVLLAEDVGEEAMSTDPADVACGFYWTEGNRGIGWAVDAVPTLKGGSTIGIPSPPAIILPNGEVIRPDIRDAERLQGFPANWTKPAEKVGRSSLRWKLVGNAVSVPVATWIGRRLLKPGVYEGSRDARIRAGDRWPRAAWNDGSGRRRSEVSEWPVRRARKLLHEFLRFSREPLSLKASAGFLARAESPHNRLNPPERLLSTLREHRGRMLGCAATHEQKTSRRLVDGFELVLDEETSARLGRVRQKGTRPELEVRRIVRDLGHRYRVTNRGLPGSPDLANRSRRWAIFVHGCFWHRHSGCRRTTTPKRNRAFWQAKFTVNQARDRRARLALQRAGFTVITIWECQADRPERLRRRLERRLPD